LFAGSLVAQAVPASQPKILHIVREIEKPNHNQAHMAAEVRWTEFNRRMGFPTTYFGLVSMSGPPEAWWLSSYDTFEALGKTFSPAGYEAGLAKVEAADAEHISGMVVMQARGLPDVSHGAFPEIGKQRVYSIMTVRMRPGYEEKFAEIAGHYKMIAQGNSGIAGFRSYEVIAGAPGGTYLVLSSFPSWAAVDANEAAWAGAMSGAGAHLEAAGKLAKEAIMNTEVRYFNVNPAISLVPKELAAADPFWAPKAATPVKTTP
jgi:hypothetical protein